MAVSVLNPELLRTVGISTELLDPIPETPQDIDANFRRMAERMLDLASRLRRGEAPPNLVIAIQIEGFVNAALLFSNSLSEVRDLWNDAEAKNAEARQRLRAIEHALKG